MGAVIVERGLPWLVGLLLGKKYRRERTRNKAEAKARGPAFKEREREKRKVQEQQDAEALERAIESNRRQRNYLRRLMKEVDENRSE